MIHCCLWLFCGGQTHAETVLDVFLECCSLKRALISTSSLALCSDFLVPDYLSQVQEEEEALGVQYELEESQHHHAFPGSSSAAATSTATSSSSSVQLPVISQVSSSTQISETSSGFLSPEALDPLEASAVLKAHTARTAGMTVETKLDEGAACSSPEESEEDLHSHSKEVASITIE
ncbi:hypothetical protein FQA47_011039 [Oryzias melastigma]|uniref:Uncharacterized protein n=1 Tax=Oryzias melastigma TaxID=30732 RepID=A0A834BSS8_ORYME|nr:hypothetical protein FQA47_011039 [Oryzias melastigma]